MTTAINRVPLESFLKRVVVEALGTLRILVFCRVITRLGGITLFRPPVFDRGDQSQH
jgi:hypothetical protein